MTEADNSGTKVLFRLPGADGSIEVEKIWATSLGGDRFRIASSPFWAYGVSLHDVVLAPFSQDEGMHVFQEVAEKAGNRTVRVALAMPVEEGNLSGDLVNALVALGCTHESASRIYIAVTIPQDVSLDEVRALLIQEDAIWEHADPTYASLYPAG
jgi:hypothetical protein